MWWILTALMVTISSSIDYIVLLVVLFGAAKEKSQVRAIYTGQLLGTGALIVISFALSRLAMLLPQDWMIGLLGLVPIGLGVYIFLKEWKETDEDEDEEEEETHSPSNIGVLSMMGLAIASGGDNMGVYTPYFTSLTWGQFAIAVLIILGLTWLLAYLSQTFGKLPGVKALLESSEQWLVPLVLVGLGLYLLIENGTLAFFLSLI